MNQDEKFKELIDLLREKKLTIGTVESMTGGLFAASLTEVAGASDVYRGSIVTYSPCLKVKLAGVREETLKAHGAVSYQVASEMALGGKKALGVDMCLSVTGNAGPTAQPGGKGIGEIYVALAAKDSVWGLPLNIAGERSDVRRRCRDLMLSLALEVAKKL